MRSLRIHIPALLVLLFVGTLLSLGSYHIGIYLSYFYWFFIIFSALDILHLLLSLFSLRYHQDFSTDHPRKNDILYYKLSVKNEGALPSARIYIESINASPAADNIHPSYSLSLRGRQKWESTLPVSCPFRGVYTVGLNRLIIGDMLGIIQIGLPVWQRTFYVYPRIIPLPRRYLPESSCDRNLSGELAGNIVDSSYFSHLNDYRSGQSIAHMYWKKFSAAGLVQLKAYDRTAQPGIELHIDRRPVPGPKEIRLKTEDISLEAALSMINYFSGTGVSVVVHLSPDDTFTLPAGSTEHLHELLQIFLNLQFSQNYSLLDILQADSMQFAGKTGAHVYITHVPDLDALEYLRRSHDESRGRLLYLNSCAFSPDQVSQIGDYVYTHSDLEHDVFIIDEKDFG